MRTVASPAFGTTGVDIKRLTDRITSSQKTTRRLSPPCLCKFVSDRHACNSATQRSSRRPHHGGLLLAGCSIHAPPTSIPTSFQSARLLRMTFTRLFSSTAIFFSCVRQSLRIKTPLFTTDGKTLPSAAEKNRFQTIQQNVRRKKTIKITIVVHHFSFDALKHISQLRFDYDTTTTRLRRKIDVNFLLASNRVEWKQARAIRRSRIVVVSQLNRNFDHFRRSRMRRGIVVS